MMNATMTCDSIVFIPVRNKDRRFLTILSRFFHALLDTSEETAHDLPENMAARLYL